MDRAAIEGLLAYTEYVWRQFVAEIRGLGEHALTRPVPGSGWPSFRDALAHINFGHDRWLGDPGGTAAGQANVPSIITWEALEADRRRVTDRARAYLDSLSDEQLAARQPMNIDGETLSFSPAEIFVHALLHEVGHHGDISTLFYQSGVEPPVMAYRFYLMEREPRGVQ